MLIGSAHGSEFGSSWGYCAPPLPPVCHTTRHFGQHFQYFTVYAWKNTHVKRNYLIHSEMWDDKGNINTPKAVTYHEQSHYYHEQSHYYQSHYCRFVSDRSQPWAYGGTKSQYLESILSGVTSEVSTYQSSRLLSSSACKQSMWRERLYSGFHTPKAVAYHEPTVL